MNEAYSQRLAKIEAEIWKALSPERIFPPALKADPEAAEFLVAPGKDLLSRGGKRWRPLLMTLVCESLGGGEAALPLVPLVEFPHNASLIHDDIEDNSDMRRGKPAAHLIYGVDTAINSGSFLYFLPLALISGWEAPADLKNLVYAAWGEHLGRLHLGQAMDIRWHRDFSSLPSIEAYFEMCALKTGALARLAAVLGVYAAQGGSGPAGNLGEAAEKLGVGFQILDDVTNLRTGNPGKRRGDDIVEGKKSLPVLLYLHRRRDRLGWVQSCFAAAHEGGIGVPQVEELIGGLDGAGILDEAKERGLALIREARLAFAGEPLLSGLIELL